MDKIEFEKKRQEVLLRQSQFLEENPEIGAWVKTKKILFRFLAVYIMLHAAVSIGIMVWLKNLTVGAAGVEIIKLLFMLLWLKLFLNERGGWRLNVMLYVSAAYNFITLIQNKDLVLGVIEYLPFMSLVPALLYAILIAMETLIPIVLLAIAIYLTVPRKHREWSEQAEAMYKTTMQDLRDAVK